MSEEPKKPELLSPEETDALKRRTEIEKENEALDRNLKLKSQLLAVSKITKSNFVVAVITVRLAGGRRRAVQTVNVDITGRKHGKWQVYGTKVVELKDNIRFSVDGRSYELDPEYIMFEMPLPTLFFERDVPEPIHFFERHVQYHGQMISTIDLIGHYSLRLDKMLEQEVIHTAANERPEAAKQGINRITLAAIVVASVVLGIMIGKFIL